MRQPSSPWRFKAVDGAPGSTLAIWRYNFTCRPRWLAPLAERIGAFLLQRDIDRRIQGYARGCVDPFVLARLDPALAPGARPGHGDDAGR